MPAKTEPEIALTMRRAMCCRAGAWRDRPTRNDQTSQDHRRSGHPRSRSCRRLGYDEGSIFIALAGPFAQKRFAPGSNWRIRGDFAVANKIISRLHGRGKLAQKYLACLEETAAEIVDFWWLEIKAVTKALLERETLTGDEIVAVIRAARRKRRRRRRVGDPPTFRLDSPPDLFTPAIGSGPGAVPVASRSRAAARHGLGRFRLALVVRP
jgi:hypothetical protein